MSLGRFDAELHVSSTVYRIVRAKLVEDHGMLTNNEIITSSIPRY